MFGYVYAYRQRGLYARVDDLNPLIVKQAILDSLRSQGSEWILGSNVIGGLTAISVRLEPRHAARAQVE